MKQLNVRDLTDLTDELEFVKKAVNKFNGNKIYTTYSLKNPSEGALFAVRWGWARPVAEVYLETVSRLGGDTAPLHCGAAHIVWSDENFDDESIKWCLRNFTKHKVSDLMDQLVIKRSLKELLKIPEKVRCLCPKNYDGENPENYPPTGEVEIIKIKG